MKRRFLIATQGMTLEQQAKVTNRVRDRGFGWWHWIDEFWLLTTSSTDVTAVSLRDELTAIAPATRTLVMEIPEDISWAGRDGIGQKNEIFDWLKATWVDKKPQ